MKERSRIIERLYEIKSDEEFSNHEEIVKLMNDLFNNRITTEDAEVKLRSIDPYYVRYEFLQNLKGKPIYKNITDYKNGKLSTVQVAKIISSLITQILIQKEQNPDIDIKSLQIDALADMIKDYSDNSDNIDFSRLDFILDKFGWKESSDDT